MKQEISFSFEGDETVDCRICKGYDEAGKTGQYFGFVYVNDRRWALVLWDGEEDPDLFKVEGLQISEAVWKDLKYK